MFKKMILDMKNLRCKYKTGRAKRHIEITSSKDKTRYTYETSIVTELGEFTTSIWEDLVKKQAKELLELDILEYLKQYSLNELAWINTDEEAYNHALELYAARIWERKSWVGYEEFNKVLNIHNSCEQISLF